MTLKLEKTIKVNFDNAQQETWFYLWIDNKIEFVTQDALKADQAFDAVSNFLTTHGKHPVNDIIRQIEI